MKTGIPSSLLALLFSSTSFANVSLDCRLLDDGEVNMNMVLIESSKEQKLSARIGFEKWSAPYQVTNLCEKLKNEVLQPSQDSWGNFECETFGRSSAKRYLLFKLSPMGIKLFGRNFLLFVPQWPLIPSFVKTMEDPGCDPY